MGEVVIHTDDDGAGAVVLDDAPVTSLERVRFARPEESPNAQIEVLGLGVDSVRIQVAGADANADVTITYGGATSAHVAGAEEPSEPVVGTATTETKKEEPTAVPKRRRTPKSTTRKEK